MKFIPTGALIGALALAGVAASAPVSAMPASPLAPVATGSSSATPVEQLRWRRGYVRRGFAARPGWRRGYGYHRGYRRGLPGRPIRRILRAL